MRCLVATLVGALGVVAVVHAVAATCVGDCDGNGTVSIDEILTGVTIALGTTPVEADGDRVREVFDGRGLDIVHGTLNDTFPAYQVHVYAVAE